MKYIRIFMLMVAATLFVACSDDDEEGWNTNSGVTVSVGDSEITWKENKGTNTPVNVPITVSGERNGKIKVTVSVAETGSNPAMDDVHYIITSKSIIIPADADEGVIELRTIDDLDINEDRTFTMSISDVEGASIGSVSSVLITLKDNDSEFYDKMMGQWTMTVTDRSGASESWKVTIEGYDEGEEGYESLLELYGYEGESNPIELNYHFDKALGQGYVSFAFPSFYAAYNFSVGPHYLGTYGYDPDNGYTDEEIIGHWNDDFTEVTFDTSKIWLVSRLFAYPSGEATGYYYSIYTTVKLTR